MKLVGYRSGIELREATDREEAESLQSFKTGEFAGISPELNEYGLICAMVDGREVLCYLQK